jgi:hypothetical protein
VSVGPIQISSAPPGKRCTGRRGWIGCVLISLTCVGVTWTLSSCGRPIPVTDLVGTYRMDSRHARATLVVKGDGTWEYSLDRPSQFRRTGKWSASRWTAWPELLSFENFEFGLALFHRRHVGLWIPKVSSPDYAADVRKSVTAVVRAARFT